MNSSIFSQYDSSSADLVEEVQRSKTSILNIARQHRHFVEASGAQMSDPEWDLAPLAALFEEKAMSADFGAKYDHMPDKMSKELYDTHELWPLLLRLNGAVDRASFKGPLLRFIRSDLAGSIVPLMRFGAARAARADALGVPDVGDLTVRRVYV